MLLHVGLEAVLKPGLGDDQRFAEQRAALRPADVEHVRQFREILQCQVVVHRPQTVAHSRPVHEQIHAVFPADLPDTPQLLLGVQRPLLGGEGQIHQLRLRQVFRRAAVIIRRRTCGDLPGGDFPVGVGKREDFVPRVFDGSGFVAVDMSGVGGDDALDGGQRRRNDHEICLGRAGYEFDQGVPGGNQLLDDRLGTLAPDILAVARETVGVCGGQGA